MAITNEIEVVTSPETRQRLDCGVIQRHIVPVPSI
jgi:hypothetical protein